MEFPEKLQQLRREHNLTQEQLAEKLFVSRTAVSKWETGRGTPGLDSLCAISALFGVSLDDLLGAQELVRFAQNENRGNLRRVLAVVFAGLDVAAGLGMFLPLYRVVRDGTAFGVPLAQLQEPFSPVLLVLHSLLILCGAAVFVCLSVGKEAPVRPVLSVSLAAHLLLTMMCILTMNPYPAAFCFLLLLAKAAVWVAKNRKKDR